MACQPAMDRRCLVRTGITARGRGSCRATYRTVAPAPPVKLAGHLAALRIEAGNERGRAVRRSLCRPPLDLARLHRNHGLFQTERRGLAALSMPVAARGLVAPFAERRNC